MDIQFVDYDNVRFHLSTAEAKTVITLSMAIQCWPDLVKYGARDHLQSTYGEYFLGDAETEPEYNVSLRIDLEKIPSGPGTFPLPQTSPGYIADAGTEEQTELISRFAHLKSTTMSAPFLDAFKEQASLQQNYKEPAGAQQADVAPTAKGDLKIIKYREEEAIFIQASNDRVTVIFSTVFKEETDRVYGRVFLQVRQNSHNHV
jgi:actin related protein 2/3 complex subunit 2